MPVSAGVFQPEQVSLPKVEAVPVEAGQPPSLEQQSAPQQQPVRPSGFTGKGGQTLNFVDHFLRGMMAGKNMREQKFIQQRSNDIKAHQITADSMYTTAQQAADEHRRLKENGAPADQVESAQKKAQETYESYTNEQKQLSAAYAKHLGLDPEGEKAKGVKGKLKAGVQQALLPQVASMMAPEAIKALATPRPLRMPSEEERLHTEALRSQKDLTNRQLDEVKQRQEDDKKLHAYAANPPAPGTKEAGEYDFLRQMNRMPTVEEEAAKHRDIEEKTKAYQFNDETRKVVRDAMSAQNAGKTLSPVQMGALKSVGMWHEKDVLGYYMDDVGKKYKTPIDAVRAFQRDQAQFSRAPSVFHELVNSELEAARLENGGKALTDSQRARVMKDSARMFRPQQDVNDARVEYQRMDWLQKRAKEIGQEKIKVDPKVQYNPENIKDPNLFEKENMEQAVREYDQMNRTPSRVTPPPAGKAGKGGFSLDDARREYQ